MGTVSVELAGCELRGIGELQGLRHHAALRHAHILGRAAFSPSKLQNRKRDGNGPWGTAAS